MKKSNVFFGISTLFLLVFGVLYVIWPLAPYHEDIIGMTAAELFSGDPGVADLMTTLVSVNGLLFIVLGIFILGTGSLAWQHRAAWLSLLVALIIFAGPFAYFTYIVAEVGGPYFVIFIPMLCQAIGLVLAAKERQWASSN